MTAIDMRPELGDVLALTDARAAEPEIAGAKAAALARAAGAGLPVVPGFVIPVTRSAVPVDGDPAVRRAWESLSQRGTVPLAVRSSSSMEDGATSSMAGRFVSVLAVRGWAQFCAAVAEVVASRDVVDLAGDAQLVRAPMAVLVQRHLVADRGGILFGADPVTGDVSRLVVAAVEGGPDRLVHGEVQGTEHTLSPRGRLLGRTPGSGGTALAGGDRRRLAALATQVANLFGGPQDVEWAVAEGRLWLLQSRPITTVAGLPEGPILGPGPVAETFPDPLSPLETDLWVEPLRRAVTEALSLTGAASRRKLRTSPVVLTVGGRVAADLDLLGALPRRRSLLARLDPRPPARRLRAAWRVGRLRAALPGLARDLVARSDAQLTAVPALDELGDAHLLSILCRGQQALTALHAHEVLMGMLMGTTSGAVSGAAVALHELAQGRAAGLADDEIVAHHPATLALVAPSLRPGVAFPPAALPPAVDPATTTSDAGEATLREALRLRARWVQELMARAAWELGGRLVRRQVIAERSDIGVLDLAELEAMAVGGLRPADLDARHLDRAGPALPAAFRLTGDGEVVSAALVVKAGEGGVPAGGGRNLGVVHDGAGPPAPGAVLVVTNLEPGLAPFLPGLAGLVAETGSPLSHLAILAREMQVPVVVGVPAAVERFPAGTAVLVDGKTGEVAVAEGVGA